MSFDVVITEFRASSNESASQLLERVLGLEPQPARLLTRQFPSAVIQRTTQVHAQIAAEQLREGGAQVEVVEHGNMPGAAAALVAAAAPVAAAAVEQQPAVAPEPVTARHLFNTVALKSLEDDLSRLEMDTQPEPPKADSSPKWDDPLEDLGPSQARGRKSAQDLPDIDELLGSVKTKGKSAAQSPQRASRGALDAGLDDLFQAPAPQGAENYFKRAAEALGNEAKKARKATGGAKAAPSARDTSRGSFLSSSDATDDEEGTGDKKARKGLILKAVAGVIVLITVAVATTAVLDAREQETQDRKTSAGGAIESKVETIRRRMHPAVRLAPNSMKASFAQIIRKQIDEVFHVQVEWPGAPEDRDCMLISDKGGKAQHRIQKLMRTGEPLAYPPDVSAQLDEQAESLRSARGSEEKFERLCLSVEVLTEADKISDNADSLREGAVQN